MDLQQKQINTRDNAIDFLKGTLVILMIMAHVIQLIIVNNNNKVLDYLSTYINLTTFSSFLFCNGYVCYIAYLRKDKESINKKLFIGIIKMLMAFYISGFFYMIFVNGKLDVRGIIEVVTCIYAPGYSEFLLSFAIVYILLLIFHDQINICINNKKVCIGVCILSLIATVISGFDIRLPLIGSIIGTSYYSSFPVIQYSSYFLAGAYLSKNKILFNKRIASICVVGWIFFVTYYLLNRQFPSRFPVSLTWIAGGYIFVYSYFIFFEKIQSKIALNFLKYVGNNTLVALVISNVIIFITHYIYSKGGFISAINTYLLGIITFAIIFIFIILYVEILKKLKRIIIKNDSTGLKV